MTTKAAAALSKLKESLSYAQETAKLEFSMQLHELMDRHSINQKQLATETGKTEAYISKALRGDCNLTIETMVALVRGTHGKFHFKIAAEDSVAWWAEVIQGGRHWGQVTDPFWNDRNCCKPGLVPYSLGDAQDERNVLAA